MDRLYLVFSLKSNIAQHGKGGGEEHGQSVTQKKEGVGDVRKS